MERILVRQEVHTLGTVRGTGVGTGNARASRTGPGPNILIPYSAKFSRDKIFADWPFTKFRGNNFRRLWILLATPSPMRPPPPPRAIQKCGPTCTLVLAIGLSILFYFFCLLFYSEFPPKCSYYSQRDSPLFPERCPLFQSKLGKVSQVTSKTINDCIATQSRFQYSPQVKRTVVE